MASKQILSPLTNAERAKATEATFGQHATDPWRAGPALAGFHASLAPDRARSYGDYANAAYTDRYGTHEIDTTPTNGQMPPRAEAAQKPEAAQKGATATNYRVPVGEVVQ